MATNQPEASPAPSPVISVVIAMFNEERGLDALFARLIPIMDGLGLVYEVVCVDDGSTDLTYARLKGMTGRFPQLRIVRLSRNFGKEIALTAGLDHALASAVIFLDADLQDPPELIPDLVALWRKGYQNVYGVRTSRQKDTFLKRLTANVFYRLFRLIGDTAMPSNAGDFRLMSGEALVALRACRERRRFMKALFAWVGYPSVAVPYVRETRAAGKSSFNYWRLWNLALEGIISHSSLLLRMWSYLGVAGVAISVLLAVYFLVDFIVRDENPPGFYVTVLVVLFFSALQMVGIGLIGEYIARMYDEIKGRPLYLTRTDALETPGVETMRPAARSVDRG